ncbi:MAG TPA: NADH-quinone oxidoreductase subunit NuoK [Nitrososphaerales archaeon]|nr:NADH-quinone oxidoreductase subunit NuoK [Nitrososphaerales archaeon]
MTGSSEAWRVIPLLDYVLVSTVLLAIGIYGLVSKGNALRLFFAIEIVVNSANLNLVAFSRYLSPVNIEGQTFALFSIAIAAAEAAVGLAIIIVTFRLNKEVDVFKLRKLKH